MKDLRYVYNVKSNEEIINKAINTKALESHLECTIDESVYEEIRKIINE